MGFDDNNLLKEGSSCIYFKEFSQFFITNFDSFVECGGMLSEKSGVITSPNFPNGYPNNLNCIWTIHRPYNRIELLFLKFILQRYKDDSVTVTEGPFKETDQLIFKYGYGNPYMNKEFADRWLWINFVTDFVHNDKGFQAIWRPYEPRV